MNREGKLRIGISFGWNSANDSFWSSGMGQNLYFLYQVLKAQPNVEEVMFVYWGQKGSTLPKEMDVRRMHIPFRQLSDAIHTIDVLIEGTRLIKKDEADLCYNHGIKLVVYKMGETLIRDMEALVHKHHDGLGFRGISYDAVWMLPHLMETNRDYLQIMSNARVQEAPMLWSPYFIDKEVKKRHLEDTITYQTPMTPGYRITTFESNMDVVKTTMTSILIMEEVYRKDKNSIAHAYLLGTEWARAIPAFKGFAGRTDLVVDKILSVEQRIITPVALAELTDIVLASQWHCGLNYSYFEALYEEYPLVHNSKFLQAADVGYYYPEFDAYKGAKQLTYVMHHYDKERSQQVKKNQAYLQSLDSLQEANVARYGQLLQDVMNNRNRL